MTLMNWSGGKDSALAFYHACKTHNLTDLLTSLSATHQRVSMHGVRREILEAQAQAIGLPLTVLELPENADMPTYQRLMLEALAPLHTKGIRTSVFGDIFLEDLRAYRERQLAGLGWTGHFPLWKRPTMELLEEFWALGFATKICALDAAKLDKEFLGQELNPELVAALPRTVDPCGENGEFHTLVYRAPYFSRDIPLVTGKAAYRTYTHGSLETGFWFQDFKLG